MHGSAPAMRYGVVGFMADGSALVGWHVGFNLFDPSSYHEVVDNPGKVLSEAAHAVTHPDQVIANAAKALAPIADIAKSIASNAVGAVSLIPGIGTGVAAALSAGLAILEGGSPLDIAIKTAYGAIPIPPGVKQFTDVVVSAVLNLLHMGGNLGAAAVKTLRDQTIGKLPGFAQSLAGQVFDTLAHLFVQAVTGKPTLAVTSAPLTAAQKAAAAAMHQAGHPLPPHLTPLPPTSHHALALHLVPAMLAGAGQAPKLPGTAHAAVPIPKAPALGPALLPPVTARSPAPGAARPGSPGAPPGATHWTCTPGPGGVWQCKWV